VARQRKATGQVPTAVSGPGALSRRTDTQPLRDIPGGSFGDRQNLTDQQRSAPLPDRTGTGGPGGVAPTAGGPPAQNFGDVFAPTDRPAEPVTTGVPGAVSGDYVADLGPDILLRALYAAFPDPAILRLIRTGL
jgi:hypothetical protein